VNPNPTIITCAITGAMHTPTMSTALPITPEQIASESIAAARAGAAIIHLHARDPADGKPTGDPSIFARFLPRIHQQSDAVINLTTGGSPTMSAESRLAAARHFAPEMCSLNMGSMNFGIFPAADRIREWRYSWEEEYVRGSDDFVFRNTFRDIAFILKTMGEAGTRFELECYDLGHLYNVAHFLDRGLIKMPFFVQLIFGILGGIGAELDNLMFMKRTADRLFGTDAFHWSVLAAGRHQMAFVTQAALMGGNVRVGLEDSLYLNRGTLAKSNAEQVLKIGRILKEMGREAATPAQARALLGLKGKGAVQHVAAVPCGADHSTN